MNTSKSLNEILWYLAYADCNRDEEKVKYTVGQAKQAIVEAVEGLIGEDEEVTMTRPRYEVPPGAKYMEFPKAHGIERNLLREELRQAIKEWQ